MATNQTTSVSPPRLINSADEESKDMTAIGQHSFLNRLTPDTNANQEEQESTANLNVLMQMYDENDETMNCD